MLKLLIIELIGLTLVFGEMTPEHHEDDEAFSQQHNHGVLQVI